MTRLFVYLIKLKSRDYICIGKYNTIYYRQQNHFGEIEYLDCFEDNKVEGKRVIFL